MNPTEENTQTTDLPVPDANLTTEQRAEAQEKLRNPAPVDTSDPAFEIRYYADGSSAQGIGPLPDHSVSGAPEISREAFDGLTPPGFEDASASSGVAPPSIEEQTTNAQEFVRDHPDDAMQVHGILTQACIDAGLISAPKVVDNTVDHALMAEQRKAAGVALLNSLRGHLNRLPAEVQAEAHSIASRLFKYL